MNGQGGAPRRIYYKYEIPLFNMMNYLYWCELYYWYITAARLHVKARDFWAVDVSVFSCMALKHPLHSSSAACCRFLFFTHDSKPSSQDCQPTVMWLMIQDKQDYWTCQITWAGVKSYINDKWSCSINVRHRVQLWRSCVGTGKDTRPQAGHWTSKSKLTS